MKQPKTLNNVYLLASRRLVAKKTTGSSIGVSFATADSTMMRRHDKGRRNDTSNERDTNNRDTRARDHPSETIRPTNQGPPRRNV
jgi:hypothetical protein